MIKVGKYIFDSEEQAETKIKGLGVDKDENGIEYPTHSHAIVRLGHEVLEEGYFDEKTEKYVEPVLSDKFLIDVVWNNIEEHPYGWKSYAVTPSGEPLHNFYGIDYLENKM
jgi:hypothetical protein